MGVFLALALMAGVFVALVAYSAFGPVVGYFGTGATLMAGFVLAGVAGGGSDV